MFDHPTITHFINHVRREGFSEVLDGLNQELLRMGLVSPDLYADSSLVKAKRRQPQPDSQRYDGREVQAKGY